MAFGLMPVWGLARRFRLALMSKLGSPQVSASVFPQVLTFALVTGSGPAWACQAGLESEPEQMCLRKSQARPRRPNSIFVL